MHCVAMMNGVSYLADNTNIVTEVIETWNF
jgi:hypothetical protein